MDKPETKRREEEGPGLWSSPYPYLALGFGFAAATAMVIATTGVLVSGLGFVIPAAALFGVGIYEFQRQ